MNCSIELIDHGLKGPLLALDQHGIKIQSVPAYHILKHSSGKSNFRGSLSEDLQWNVCTFADVKSLCSISAVSREWSKSSRSEDLWKTLFEQDRPHAQVNVRGNQWKRHYFFLCTVDYRCQQAYASGVERGALYNWSLVNAVRLTGLVATSIGIFESSQLIGSNGIFPIVFGCFEFFQMASPWLVMRCRNLEDRRWGLLATRSFNFAGVLRMGGAFLIKSFPVKPYYSEQVCASLLASHMFLLFQGERPWSFKCIENGLGNTVGVAKSLCTRVSDLVGRLFCCRRRYFP